MRTLLIDEADATLLTTVLEQYAGAMQTALGALPETAAGRARLVEELARTRSLLARVNEARR